MPMIMGFVLDSLLPRARRSDFGDEAALPGTFQSVSIRQDKALKRLWHIEVKLLVEEPQVTIGRSTQRTARFTTAICQRRELP